MGNGQKLYVEGCVRAASFLIQNFEVVTYLFTLSIGGADVILGIAWLSTLGKIVHDDYKHLTMQFTDHCRLVELQGESSWLKGEI